MTITTIERERIDHLAAEYRRNGYAVTLEPSPEELPAFLSSFKPDLIAQSDHGNVVVEVRSARHYVAEEIKRLAEAVGSMSGWRFEVVLANPPVAPDVPAQGEIAADDDVARLIEDAGLLAREKHIEAAALIAWSAAEAILRRAARSAAPEVERESSARVLKHFYALGRLDQDIYEKLSRLMHFRNAVAHGFAPSGSPPDIPELLAHIRNLQKAA